MESEVTVHTSLPPGVEGQIFSHLYLQIPYIIWDKTFKNYPQEKICVKACWWGEKADGALFYPSIIYNGTHNSLPKTTAKYKICSDYTKFKSYLKDMGKLYLKVLSITSVLGTTKIDKIFLLTSDLQISGLFPVISQAKKKIAELFVKITIEKFTDDERNSKVEKSLDTIEETSISIELKKQHDARRNNTNDIMDNSDLITALLEKAENLRQAMIVSLLENKNLEYVLENERKKLKDEETKKSELIENVLGIQKNVNQQLASTGASRVIDLNDSSSSLESKVNDFSESFDSVPDDAVINELFYSDANIEQTSTQQLHHNYQNNTYPLRLNDSRKAIIQAKTNKLAEKKEQKTANSHKLSSEMRLIIENIKLFKVRIKDITFQFSEITSNAAENSIKSLLQRHKPRTFIVEFLPPFSIKVGLWDHKGHRKESTDVLRFISRKVKNRAVSFEQDVNIPFESNISAEEIVEKELVFCAKARLHDIRKIIDLGKGKIKVKDCIAAGSSSLECCIPLHNNIQTTSAVEYKKHVNEIVHPTLRIEVNLVISEFKCPLDKAVATSDDDIIIIKDSDNTAVIQSVSEDSQPANKCDLILTEPLHCILQITEGKNFGEKKWLHIVCRLFFSKNAVFRDILYNPDEPTICFSQIFPILLNKELLKQTENNVMVIEVWERLNLSEQMHLKGLCKLPLHCFYLVFKNAALARSHLLCKYPIISTSGETPVVHPVTGCCNGEFNILFALGTLQQIDNILEESFLKVKAYKSSINYEESTSNKYPIVSRVKTSARVSHTLEVLVQELGGLKISSNMVWGEADCYVTYCFPTQENGEVKVHLYKSNSQLIMPDVIFKSIKQFVFFLNEEEELEDFLMKELTSCSDKRISTNEKYPVKLWGNFYNPYQRTELLASTYLSLTDLCGMIKKAKNIVPPAHHSFKIPFQRSYTNNCRLKVGYIKFNISYWRHSDKKVVLQDSAIVDNINIDENNMDSLEVHSTKKKSDEDLSVSKLMTNNKQRTRDISTETDVSETVAKRQDDNIPERDGSAQSFCDKISSKIHQNKDSSNLHFSIPVVSQSTTNDELYCVNRDFTFNAHVVIERALHLLRTSDKKSKDLAPSTYVIFNTDDQTEFTTNTIRETCDPIWNWHHDVTFATANPSIKSGVNLKFKVLHQTSDENNAEPGNDQVLGTAVVELTPLLHGLSKISGWYNLTDASGKCQGQIKISISPERNEIFQQAHCSCTIQPDRSKQNKVTKKNSLAVSSQSIINSFPTSPTSSLQKQLEELDLLYSYLTKRLAQLPVTNKMDESLKSSSNQRHMLNKTINQSNILDEENKNYQDNISSDYARNDLITDFLQITREESKSNQNDDQIVTEAKLNSEKNTECKTNDKAMSCSVHFNCGKPPIFKTPISPHKTIQYTTYIHSKCINSSSSLHALQHEDGVKCDYCDKLEVINSTVETIDLSTSANVQELEGINTKSIELTKQSTIDTMINVDDKNNSESVTTASSPSVEFCRIDSSHSYQKDKIG